MANPDISDSAMRPIKPSGPVPDTPSGLVVKPKACIQCRTRKVKCDREAPCGNCVRWNLDCVFPSPIRKCRRSRKPTAGSSPGAGRTRYRSGTRSLPPDVMKMLEEALQRLAELIEKHEIGTAGEQSLTQLGRDGRHSSVGTGDWDDLRGKLAVVTELVSSLSGCGELQPPEFQTSALLNGLSSSLGVFNHPPPQPFPIDTFNLDVSPFHPPSVQIGISWKAFLLSIDPLVKVLHRHTTENILLKAACDSTSLSNSETAIVFTIYFSSLSTLSDEDAQRCFGVSRQAAQSTFKSAAEHALAKTNLLAQADAEADLPSLQAFVLFLSQGRFTDHAPRIWALTGLVRRLESISAWKISSPFEEEIRRRLRWELWCLDHRAHEDGGRGPAPLGTGGAPELPLNVRDADLDPSIATAPLPAPGWTEVSFSLVRFEIARTARTVELLPSASEKLAMVDECERRVQSMYLDYCDGTEPVHWLAQHVAHVLLMELRFKLLRHDRCGSLYSRGCPDLRALPAQDGLFLQAIDIVDTPRRVEAEPQAKQWSWLLVAYMQFWPLSFLLCELRHRHGSEEVERGWDVAERALARRKEGDTSKNMEILRQLMEEARREKNHRMIGTLNKAAPVEVSRRVEADLTSLDTPTLFKPFVEGDGSGLAGDGSLGYMALEDSLLPSTYNGAGWSGTQLPGYSTDGSFDFMFDDEDPFPHLEGPMMAPLSSYTL